jgi:hypothetical protein
MNLCSEKEIFRVFLGLSGQLRCPDNPKTPLPSGRQTLLDHLNQVVIGRYIWNFSFLRTLPVQSF